MKGTEIDQIVFLIVIAERNQKDALLSALLQSGAHLTSAIYARGTVQTNYWQNLLGFVPEENKVMISCILTHANSDAVLKMLIEKFHFDKPNTGVAFTTPIERLSF